MSTLFDVRAMDGTVTGTVTLDADIFACQPNVPVMHQVVTAQLAAARSGAQSTKTRAEVSGGGAKPFKQKGTGRARQGSTRAPHYAGGGIALGPKPRSYRQRTPRKMVQLALRSALSDRAGSGRVAVVDAWDFEIPNTKAALGALGAIGVTGRALVVLSRDDELAYKSFRNLPDVELVVEGELAAYDVLCSDWLVFTRATLPGNNVWAQVQAEPAQTAAAAKAATPKAHAKPSRAVPEAEVGEGAPAAQEDDAVPHAEEAQPVPEPEGQRPGPQAKARAAKPAPPAKDDEPREAAAGGGPDEERA